MEISLYALILFLLLINCYIDSRIGLLTNKINLVILGLGFLWRIIFQKDYMHLFYDALICFFIICGSKLAYRKYREYIGMGDIKTYCVLTIFFGFYKGILIVLFSNITALIFISTMILIKKFVSKSFKILKRDSKKIVMGPHIFGATLIVIAFF